MSNWFEWKDEDLKELGIKDLQFFDYLKEGLYPYTRYTYEPVRCPEEHHAYKYVMEDLEEIKFTLKELKKLDGLEKEVKKTKTVYIKSAPPGISYILGHHKDYLSNLDDNKGYPITPEIIEELKTYRNELVEGKPKIENRLKDIRNDPERFSWRYFVLPRTTEDCDKLKSELTDKEDNIFKKDIALEIKRKFDSEAAGKDKEVTSTRIDSQELADLKEEGYLEDAKLTNLLKEARPEIDSFYDAIKKYLKEYDFPTRKLAKFKEKDWVTGTETIFTEPEDELNYIKQEYLRDRTLYKVDPGHPRRDFIAALLQKVVKDHFPENPEWWGDRQKLYDLSQKIEKNLLPNLNSQ